jgi:TnpA family transposase
VGLAGLVLAGTPRDSLFAVDLMYRRDGEVRPEVFISDTGSYSDMVFGLLKLLGVDYRPELADLPDQKLWRINPSADYGPLDQAARGKIDLSRVKRTGRHRAGGRLGAQRPDLRLGRDTHAPAWRQPHPAW